MTLRSHAPEACASTNSATSARHEKCTTVSVIQFKRSAKRWVALTGPSAEAQPLKGKDGSWKENRRFAFHERYSYTFTCAVLGVSSCAPAVGLDNETLKYSPLSLLVSLMIGTVNVLLCSPGSKVSVPLVEV